MASGTGEATTTATTAPPSTGRRWRVVDIVVAAVLGVAGGVLFAVMNISYESIGRIFSAVPPLTGLVVGVWLLPGVLGMLVIRKPGAALFTELVAALVSALIGSTWGLSVLWYGLLEGLAPELVFAAFAYRSFGRPVALLAGAAAGVAAAGLDLVVYYSTLTTGFKLAYAASVIVSGAVIAGLGGSALTRALARTGATAHLTSGRDGARV